MLSQLIEGALNDATISLEELASARQNKTGSLEPPGACRLGRRRRRDGSNKTRKAEQSGRPFQAEPSRPPRLLPPGCGQAQSPGRSFRSVWLMGAGRKKRAGLRPG